MANNRVLVAVGGAIQILGGLLILWLPLQFATELAVIGGALTYIGMGIGLAVVACGIVTALAPRFALFSGIAGVVFSIASLVGALGGLFVGMLLGLTGSAFGIYGGYHYRRTGGRQQQPRGPPNQRRGRQPEQPPQGQPNTQPPRDQLRNRPPRGGPQNQSDQQQGRGGPGQQGPNRRGNRGNDSRPGSDRRPDGTRGGDGY